MQNYGKNRKEKLTEKMREKKSGGQTTKSKRNKKNGRKTKWRKKKTILFFRYGWLQVQLVCAALYKCHVCARLPAMSKALNQISVFAYFALAHTQRPMTNRSSCIVLVPGPTRLSHDIHDRTHSETESATTAALVWHCAHNTIICYLWFTFGSVCSMLCVCIPRYVCAMHFERIFLH